MIAQTQTTDSKQIDNMEQTYQQKGLQHLLSREIPQRNLQTLNIVCSCYYIIKDAYGDYEAYKVAQKVAPYGIIIMNRIKTCQQNSS